MFSPGLDLNFGPLICQPASNLFAGGIDAYGQVDLCAVDGASAADNLSSLCGALWWTSQGQTVQLFGSIPLDDLCATDFSRKPARYRSFSARPVLQALPPGHPLHGIAQHLGQRQRNSGLAYLLRFRTELDRDGEKALRQRTFWSRSERYRVASRCHHHRSVSVDLSVGCVSLDQSGYQTAHAFGLEGQYPFFH